MTASDIFLERVGAALVVYEVVPAGAVVGYRDSDDTIGELQIILDADAPQEDDRLDGVYDVGAEIRMEINVGDHDDLTLRRDMLGSIETAMRDDLMAAVIEAASDVQVYDISVDGATWQSEGRYVIGKVRYNAKFSAAG